MEGYFGHFVGRASNPTKLLIFYFSPSLEIMAGAKMLEPNQKR
jgi:hypothetical protein